MAKEKKRKAMTKKEIYDWFFHQVKQDTYSCKKCNITAKYSMYKFNKTYKKEFNTRVDEITKWHLRNPDINNIFIGDIRRLMDIVITGRCSWGWQEELNGNYQFKNVGIGSW